MAGLWVTVCVSLPPGDDVLAAIGEAMAPFATYQGFAPERDIWDSWTIRGGSDGTGFWLIPGMEDDPAVVHDQPHYTGELMPSLPGMCAGGPRRLLDLGRRRAEAEVAAGKAWDVWNRHRQALPEALSLSVFMNRPENAQELVWRNGAMEPPSNLGYERAVAQYLAQPLLQAVLNEDPENPLAATISLLPHDDPVILAKSPREAYVSAAAARATRFGDLLTLDGWWVSTDQMPIHGACESMKTCPHKPETAVVRTRAGISTYVEQLPPDTTIVSLKCHT